MSPSPSNKHSAPSAGRTVKIYRVLCVCLYRTELREAGWCSERVLVNNDATWSAHPHCGDDTQTHSHHASSGLKATDPITHEVTLLLMVHGLQLGSKLFPRFHIEFDVKVSKICCCLSISKFAIVVISRRKTFWAQHVLLCQVMLSREDLVVSVQNPDGSQIVEHADGTRITSLYQDRPPNSLQHTGEPHTVNALCCEEKSDLHVWTTYATLKHTHKHAQ